MVKTGKKVKNFSRPATGDKMVSLKDLSGKKRLQLALEQFSYKKYGYCVIYHELFSSGGINFIKKLGEHCTTLLDLELKYDTITKKTSQKDS